MKLLHVERLLINCLFKVPSEHEPRYANDRQVTFVVLQRVGDQIFQHFVTEPANHADVLLVVLVLAVNGPSQLADVKAYLAMPSLFDEETYFPKRTLEAETLASKVDARAFYLLARSVPRAALLVRITSSAALSWSICDCLLALFVRAVKGQRDGVFPPALIVGVGINLVNANVSFV